ncbi:MAG: M48 family metalloprotease [Candidatus Portiera sp.]|nr:M48 family metalloprotease [Portiera sp.]
MLMLPLSESAYAANDPTNIGETSVISIRQQESLGRSWLRDNYKRINPLNDIIIQAYSEDLVKRLKQGRQLSRYNVNLVISKNRQFNAFALPGGVIGINLGIFLLAESEGEFASVIAHELSHLSQEHFLRRLEYSKSNNRASLGAIFAGLALLISGNVPLGTAAIVGTIGYQTDELLRLSRQFENEADAQALELLDKGKFDVKEMPVMLGRLRSLGGNDQVAVYYRTHPLTADRMNYALQRARQYKVVTRQLLADEYDFVHQRALFLAGRGGQYLAKKNNSDRAYTDALFLLEQSKYAQAINLLKRVNQQHPTSRIVLYSLLDALIKGGSSNQALKLIDDSLRYNNANPTLEYYRALAYAKMEDYDKAILTMGGVTNHYLENPDPWLQLSIYYSKVGDRYNLFRTTGVYHLLSGNRDKMQANFQLAKREAGKDEVKIAVLQSTYARFN